MKTSVYLIVTKTGVVDMLKLKKPNLNSGQVAVKINLEVSDKFFDRLVPEVDINIPDRNIIVPKVEVTVPDRVMEALTEEIK